MIEKYKYILLGLLTYVPGAHALLHRGTGGTNSARYCYSTWLRHVVQARVSGYDLRMGTLAEIGPGDSLGIGLSGLISGFQNYYAFDHVAHAASQKNLDVFDELVELFRARTPVPSDIEFPFLLPKLEHYEFPSSCFPNIAEALEPARLRSIRSDLETLDGAVRYIAPWQSWKRTVERPVDFIISQAVMEHVDELEDAYAAMNAWLSPGGIMSHQIDYKSHAMSKRWNGHLSYSDRTWRLMRGRLPYLLNRSTYSIHMSILKQFGLRQSCEKLVIRTDGIDRHELAPAFCNLPEADLKISDAFIQFVKQFPE